MPWESERLAPQFLVILGTCVTKQRQFWAHLLPFLKVTLSRAYQSSQMTPSGTSAKIIQLFGLQTEQTENRA